IVGVNSRDLKTLTTDLAVAERLAGMIPSDRLSVAESGIKTHSDIAKLKKVEYSGFLIGESILREAEPGMVLRALAGEE
ncbi:indole-3-glycerol phosphate synthase, partial [bacterium E08(2017)]